MCWLVECSCGVFVTGDEMFSVSILRGGVEVIEADREVCCSDDCCVVFCLSELRDLISIFLLVFLFRERVLTASVARAGEFWDEFTVCCVGRVTSAVKHAKFRGRQCR